MSHKLHHHHHAYPTTGSGGASRMSHHQYSGSANSSQDFSGSGQNHGHGYGNSSTKQSGGGHSSSHHYSDGVASITTPKSRRINTPGNFSYIPLSYLQQKAQTTTNKSSSYKNLFNERSGGSGVNYSHGNAETLNGGSGEGAVSSARPKTESQYSRLSISTPKKSGLTKYSFNPNTKPQSTRHSTTDASKLSANAFQVDTTHGAGVGSQRSNAGSTSAKTRESPYATGGVAASCQTPTASSGNSKVGMFQSNNSGIPNHEPTKCSLKKSGLVSAYAANTNQGIVRNYNEDRVSIILNIMKPANKSSENWPKCSFFGVYDGHGGPACADFLRDNLHQFVIRESSFPWNPKEALRNGFMAAERHFIEMAQNMYGEGQLDKSGSCAIVILIVGEMCYCANVGDSRALLSGDGGSKIFPLSRDHKPLDELENRRIIEGGGKIYQTQTAAPRSNFPNSKREYILGPHRVLPGRLSVSRTFGDAEAKLPKYGGNPNVIVAEPEIKAFKISKEHDYIIMASDGIFDKMSNKEVIQGVWTAVSDAHNLTIHQQAGLGVETVMKTALAKRTLDNITVVLIGFSNFKKRLFSSSAPLNGISNNIPRDFTTNPNGTMNISRSLKNQTAQRSSISSASGGRASLRLSNDENRDQGSSSSKHQHSTPRNTDYGKYGHGYDRYQGASGYQR
eukprot:CAMPEP_0114995738 /NCGR_PEP_ID=MMETSP0216-20121206/13908_1 /TAXON_ID=223996 /ORGANISM="Protocruzia adherens, Strain Boccale" /LENGTH=676 /DNA_ID=CAMNT_0002359837 /DNA_START=319 /DNA_END=2349 /DNA_ORIENTATION=+